MNTQTPQRELLPKLKKLHRSLVQQARLRAIDADLFAGQRDYRRFLIVGQGRSGSNLLRGLLNSHPQVTAFGELFRLDARIDWGIPLWHTPSSVLERFRTAPRAFLDADVFRPFPGSIRAVGFKLFYDHARAPGRDVVWTHLLDDARVHVLHLTRRNLLASLVSLRHAERSGRWVATSERSSTTSRRPLQLVLTPDECVTYFEASRHRQIEFAQSLPCERIFDLCYEDLVDRRDDTCVQLQRSLGLPERELSTSTVKQLPFAVRDVVANFDDLARTFAATPWHTFFDA